MSVNSFRDLRVWQAAMELVACIYDVTKSFPSHETYGLVSQMRRAAVSVPSNIAEGHTRESTKEYLHHISMAQASLAELQTQIETAVMLDYLPGEATPFLNRTTSLSKQLYALRNGLIKTCPKPPSSNPASARRLYDTSTIQL
jgi:four helix bundle protein